MNPGNAMKMMAAMSQFTNNHPKFAAFLRAMFGTRIEAGTIIEITVTRPGEEPITGNMRVLDSDLELVESLKELAKQ